MVLFLTGIYFWDQTVLWSAPISVVSIFHRGATGRVLRV